MVDEYFRVMINKNLTFIKHAEYVVKKVRDRMNAMKVLSALFGVGANLLMVVQKACFFQ